jgi:hypothetical protein
MMVMIRAAQEDERSMSTMQVDEKGRYVITGYDTQSAFASFLPGIAGPLGVPLWAFYVNRGQAIASLGVGSKESAIIEFRPAIRAYQSVATTGFRTFVTVAAQTGAKRYCEPFARTSPLERPATEMSIGLNDLEICDTRSELGLRFNVLYFLLPSQPFGCLVRRLTVTNVSDEPLAGELIDGLPAIIPFGVPTNLLNQMANTMAAWMRVENLESGVPFYRIDASVEDRPEVAEIDAGHFYACFTGSGSSMQRLKPIVDPQIVFGSNTSLAYPDRFLEGSLDELLNATQITTGRMPCGMFGTAFDLAPGAALAMCSLIGNVPDVGVINRAVMAGPGDIDAKHREAISLTETVTRPMRAQTASLRFDLYCRQTFLDNLLRGGLPLAFPNKSGTHIYHIYGRRHGDLERDYNSFVLTPERFSQGNGAYRDVNQNRRCDVFIEPRVEDGTVATFMNLIQLDGYNPLELRPYALKLDAEGREAAMGLVGEDAGLRKLLAGAFTPGSALTYIEKNRLALRCEPMTFVETLFRHAVLIQSASFGEGYWVDHWAYNLDLIDAYLAVYPDREEEFLFDRCKYTFYDGSAIVRPRSERYVEVGGVARQLGAVIIDHEKQAAIERREDHPNAMRTERGKGHIYQTHLVGKLVALGAIKFSTLDPCGMGIEMEAGKPGWYDALNGLPALFGSSLSETFELQRLLVFLRKVMAKYPQRRFVVAREVWDYLKALSAALEQYRTAEDDGAHDYWDHVSGLREAFREQTHFGLSGREVEICSADLGSILEAFLTKVESGIAKARQLNDGLAPTYFRYEPAKWHALRSAEGEVVRNENGQVRVQIESFRVVVLPLFLEGLVKQMKLADSVAEASALYARVKTTGIYDPKLGMYKVNASLDDQPLFIGRAKAYTPGWLENESIFLHMHYKYLLALLTAGLYEQFWQEAGRGLVPFFDPEVYGRSILENSSFLVSSVHPDAQLHGRGFVARLSGATAEFLNMWIIATVGAEPFQSSDNGLTLELSPHLPGWLFRDDGTLTFTFLGRTQVTYHNPSRSDLLNDAGSRITRITLESTSGEAARIADAVIAEPWASRVRDGAVQRIDVYFGESASR